MTSHGNGKPLPKFGEWDVNNPASADGFTVIFANARDEKNATDSSYNVAPAAPRQMNNHNTTRPQQTYHQRAQKKRFCCF